MPKNIIICCDGTGNEFGTNNTNVVKIYQLAIKADPGRQTAYYDPGVGTGGWEYEESTDDLKAKQDGATGFGLQKNVEDAYKYLMRNYEEGDRIFLFGFSRGAFTVRALAGMLHKCGLLYPDILNMVEYASKIYNTAGNAAIAREFKRTMARKCPVHFIGVWDTVASLALNAGKKFHDAKMNQEVTHGYHAVSLDEIRAKFPPSLWKARKGVEQVWFAGVHSDVGGWYSNTGLSDIALNWMGRKAAAHGMLLDEAKLSTIKGDPLAMQHDSHTGLFWTAMGKHIRDLPAGTKVHTSVRTRLGKKVQIGDDNSKKTGETAYKPAATVSGKPFTKDAKGIEWVE